MKIALDIDGVVADIQTEFEVRLKETFGIEVDREVWKTYFISTQFPEVPQKWVDEQFADPTFYLNALCREDAWYMVNKWFMTGSDVFLVTCRGQQHNENIEKLTHRWLDEWELNYNKVFFNSTRLEKYKTCMNLRAEFFVEDDPHEAQIASQYLPTYLLDHAYNRDYDIGTAKRIKDLYEIDSRVGGNHEPHVVSTVSN